MIRNIWKALKARFKGRDGLRAASTSPEPSSSGDSTKSTERPGAVTAALRHGKVELAQRKLDRWREHYLRARRNAVREALLRLDDPSCTQTERQQLEALLADTEAAAVTAALVKKANQKTLALEGVASFRESIALRTRRGQLASFAPEWKLNSKVRGYRFMQKQGVPCPELFEQACPVSELTPRTGVAVKPMSGAASRGVYLVLGDGRVFEPKRGEWLDDWSAMQAAMQADLDAGRVGNDSWIVEELVTEDEAGLRPGRDLKFYCFYGKVGLVLEVERWQGNAYCEWDDTGNQVFSGKYDEHRFDGEGVTAEQIELVRRLSLKIPAPFIRIDFLRSARHETGLSFCEFTPRPGNFHRFGKETDQRLGELYLKAEARLQKALLTGKRFQSPFNLWRSKGKQGS